MPWLRGFYGTFGVALLGCDSVKSQKEPLYVPCTKKPMACYACFESLPLLVGLEFKHRAARLGWLCCCSSAFCWLQWRRVRKLYYTCFKVKDFPIEGGASALADELWLAFALGYWDNYGKENGNYYIILGYIGVMLRRSKLGERVCKQF